MFYNFEASVPSIDSDQPEYHASSSCSIYDMNVKNSLSAQAFHFKDGSVCYGT